MSSPAKQSRRYPDWLYPDSDGKRMAENTLQFRWIVTLKENVEKLFRDRPDVFVAGDNLIYPLPRRPTVRTAPDVYVAFGRPKGRRGSYKLWVEGDVFPQVIFEVLSPGNRAGEMARKKKFYAKFGAEEYYVYDPDRNTLEVWTRDGNDLRKEAEPHGWVSPRLGIRFDLSGPEMVVTFPDGRPFQTFQELAVEAEQEKARAEQEKARADQQAARAEQEKARAEQETSRAEQERVRAERMAAKLRELGLDPDAV